ncbi:hypothetical protein Pan5_43 [Pseudanabaena phage Pan5]|nr:hypothetical protein Pan5_43 [Pseudanabaena phage Pan5]
MAADQCKSKKMYYKDILGQKYGRLLVVSFISIEKRHAIWLCKCECGNYTNSRGSALIGGHKLSCGCITKERLTKHNLYSSPLYKVWSGIKTRCNPKTSKIKDRKYYSDLGISVCDSWKSDFLSFYNWAINNGWVKGMHIDRINQNGDYSPDNCRVVTRIQNGNNRRDNRNITLNGKKKSIAEWSRELNIKYTTIKARLDKGLSPADVLLTNKIKY